MDLEKKQLIHHILETGDKIYNRLNPPYSSDWLSSDITVTQLRVLLALSQSGPSKMTDITNVLGVSLPTTSGVVDNLVKKGLVVRDTDPSDRRLVICKLSNHGRAIIDKLLAGGRFQMQRLLSGLSTEQMKKAVEVADFLLENLSEGDQFEPGI